MDGIRNPGISGGMGRGRRNLPDGSDGDLRRPYSAPQEPRNNYSSDGTNHLSADINTNDSVQKLIPGMNHLELASNAGTFSSFSLSAEAPEFIPKFIQPGISAQVSNNHMSLEQNIPNVRQEDLAMFGPQEMYMEHPVILEVNDMVVKLTLKPQKYEQIATQLTSILSYRVKEPNLMKEVLSVIFEQGIGEANFRFNGGRLCQHLARNVTAENPSFKSLLLQRCQHEYSCAAYYLQTEPSRLYGFTLFLADIFCHLLTPTGQHQNSLRSGLCDLLIILLTHSDASSLKCAAQVLKCCGKFLDTEGNPKMSNIMAKLRDVSMVRTDVPSHIQTLLLSVVELRAANWGRGNEDVVSKPDLGGPAPSQNNVGVAAVGTHYYSPEGIVKQVVNETEDDSSSDTDDSFYGFTADGQEVDDEIAKDFEAFILSQGK